MTGPVLAIGQSGAVCRAVLFSPDRRVLASAEEALAPRAPRKGYIEFDPLQLWSTILATCRAAMVRARVDPGSVAAIGIVGDADTTLAWERETGRPVYNAIAAADRRTEGRCQALREMSVEPTIRTRTGLRLDAGRAATKLAWILDNVVSARSLAEEGKLAYGNIACYLLAHLTDGRVHAVDAASAAGSLLFNTREQSWDATLLDIFSIPDSVLPGVFDNATYFGAVDAAHFGGSGPIGIHGMAGTEQAALMGQGGLAEGSLGISFESGCAAMLSTGRTMGGADGLTQAIAAARLGGRVTYAVLSANRAAGAAFEWVRTVLDLGEAFDAADRLAKASDPDGDMVIVPAGLTAQAPWHRGPAPGLIRGLQGGATPADLVRAALETAAFTTADLVASLGAEAGGEARPPVRVSGGVAASDWAMQFLADILNRAVERLAMKDTAALGIAWLAASAAGVWPDLQEFSAGIAVDRRFEPRMAKARRMARIDGWHIAVRMALSAGGRVEDGGSAPVTAGKVDHVA